MSIQKKTGSYYTPLFLSEFIMQYLSFFLKGKEYLSFLEPSVGDGSFVGAFHKCFKNSTAALSFTAIDIVDAEIKKAEAIAQSGKLKNCTYDFKSGDFLEIQKNISTSFSCIAGNPPYIKKQLLSKEQIALCEEIHQSENLSKTSIKSIWSAFMVRLCQLLAPDGVIALILPAEMLQVNYTEELRKLLVSTFQRTEIFTFDDLLFDCKGQDTILFFGFKIHSQPGQYYTHIKNTEQLQNNEYVLTQNNAVSKTKTKWSHHTLPSEDLIFLDTLKAKINPISKFCQSKPGIVTAANNFFIIDDSIEQEFNLQNFTQPIIQKALHINGSVVFSKEDYDALTQKAIPNKVIVFRDEDVLTEQQSSYIKLGVEKNLHNGHKCSLRKNWYVIPNISTSPDAFFLRRCHHYPKLILNSANVLITDTAYKVDIKAGYHLKSLIYSFYNSLSLTFAELAGRYYGGGVLELTPVEFKDIPVPYTTITENKFSKFTKDFEQKKTIYDVLKTNDQYILRNCLNLSNDDILRIQEIYKKLVNKRLRNK